MELWASPALGPLVYTSDSKETHLFYHLQLWADVRKPELSYTFWERNKNEASSWSEADGWAAFRDG